MRGNDKRNHNNKTRHSDGDRADDTPLTVGLRFRSVSGLTAILFRSQFVPLSLKIDRQKEKAKGCNVRKHKMFR